ncbi:MAG: biotin--[acetyl-CoA-carboxylase] ligase [Pyrinomonadaceae bacterium]
MSQPFQPVILRFDEISSTNTEAISQAQRGAPEGVCIVARAQTQGRGRHGRAWSSPPDAGLYFSVILRPRIKINRWSLITLMCALAARDALHAVIESYGCDANNIDIKWSNDILFNKRKVCGILAEAFETLNGRVCIIGIGINLRRDAYPQYLSETAISLEEVIASPPNVESVLRELIESLQRYYAQLHAPDGCREILRVWIERSTYAHGKLVRVASINETFDGTTRGLETDGALRVELRTGEIKIVRTGDITALREIKSAEC